MSAVRTRTLSLRRTLTAQAWQAGENLWVSFCPELDLYSQGESENEAFEAISETVHLHLKHTGERRKRGESE